MKRLSMLIILLSLGCNSRAQGVLYEISEGRIEVDSTFVEQTFSVSRSALDVSYSNTSTINTSFGNLRIEFGNDSMENEYGFNIINIHLDGTCLMGIKQYDLWTYMFNGRSMIDFSRFTENRYCIPINLATDLSLIICCGWPYGGELPLLTVIAITSENAEVVYNRHVEIQSLSKNPFEMLVQTNLVEYLENGTPLGREQRHKIYYKDGKLIYE